MNQMDVTQMERPQETVQPDALEAQLRMREEELGQREKQIRVRELRAQAMEALCALQMPAELAELLDYTDEAACQASLEKVKKIWHKAVQKGVESRMAGSAPRTGEGKSGAGSTMRDAISAYYNH